MTRIIWAPQAIGDVEAIRAYVARDSAHYADLLVEWLVYRLRLDLVEIVTVFHRARLFPLD